MYYEIVIKIAVTLFYWISLVTFDVDFTKKLLNRICPNFHRILRLFMLICQNEFNLCTILTECGGILMKSAVSKMPLKYAQYIHDAEMEKFILTRLCQFGGHQIRNLANLQFYFFQERVDKDSLKTYPVPGTCSGSNTRKSVSCSQ